jgi:2-methylisocitrate lyase-like PEP mutase family enzyme
VIALDAARTAAAAFRALHKHPPLVLANAWDAASAAVIESVGATAIGTTSAGISWACGTPDGERLSRDRMVQAVNEIIAVVRIPVTADIESGYGATSDDLAMTVSAFLGVGVGGINIEDSPGTDTPLRDPQTQAARIRAVRATADQAGVALWINARTDTYLVGVGSPDEQLDETMTRAVVYAAAGADSLFVPGVLDIGVIRDLATGPLPLNVMVGPGAPNVAALAQVGVARISVGSAIAQSVYGLVARSARELLSSGTYLSLHDALGFEQLNQVLQPAYLR